MPNAELLLITRSPHTGITSFLFRNPAAFLAAFAAVAVVAAVSTPKAEAQVALTTLHSFCSQGGSECTDGLAPVGGLVQGSDGNFYGTTSYGGASYAGTIFKLTPSGAVTTLHTFCLQANCPDGRYPEGGLLLATDGNFYGTAGDGGAEYGGTALKITPSGTLTTLYSFCTQGRCADGYDPVGGLAQGSDGNFYGTTTMGGANYSGFFGGTVFKITPSGALTTLYSFCSQAYCTDGGNPLAGLVQGSDGNFYGTTLSGGVDYSSLLYGGTVFKITPSGTLTTLYSFCPEGSRCTEGANPVSGLVQGSDGNFYGTTTMGGANGYYGGTVFKITPNGTMTVLYSFCSETNCTDGMSPRAGLLQGSDGNFYGTTSGGGANGGRASGGGTVFRISPSGVLTTLYSFCSESNCADGAYPYAGLVQGSDGNFYGTTNSGGAGGGGPDGGGTAFKFSPQLYPQATVTPASLALGTSADGATSAPEAVTLTNTGMLPLSFSGVTFAGADAGDFAEDGNNCPSSLAVGASCNVRVTFKPGVLGGESATLNINDNAENGPQSVALSGTGSAAVLLFPGLLSFGTVAEGSSETAALTLANPQSVALNNITIMTSNPDFAVTSTTCGSILNAHGLCTISVTFRPSIVGTEGASLSVTDSAGNSPQTVILTGTGKAGPPPPA